MKPFLAVNLTSSKKNEQCNGDEFFVIKTSDAMTQSLENSSDTVDKALEKSKMPLIVRIFHWIFGAASFLIPMGIVTAMTDEEDPISLKEIYTAAPWLFWVAGICLAIWGVLTYLSHKKQKSVLEGEESTMAINNLEGNCDAIFMELGVPSNARDVDILQFYYKEKDGKVKVTTKGLQTVPYVNPVFKIFADEYNVYLACLEGKYAFPRTSFRSIDTVKKATHIFEWNKDIEHNEGEYKQYKITETDGLTIICKKHHILNLEINGEQWGIYFPDYELPVFEFFTGLKAQTE